MKKQLTPEEEEYKRIMAIAMASPLTEKVCRAIEFLQFHETLATQNHEEGYYLAYSGGKDSTVILALAKMAGVRFRAYYNQTTIDPPELVRFIQQQENITWSRPERHLIWEMVCTTEGPPTKIARWCCKKYKELGGNGRVKLLGVRAAESPRRAQRWREITPNRSGGTIICPIIYWTDEDIWTFIHHFSIPYCSLYDEGFKRLGCVGCPMVNPKETRRAFDRWPGFERLWKLGFRKYWERWHGVLRRDGQPRGFEKFGNWETHWHWWLTRKKWEPGEECQGQSLLSQMSGGSE